MSSLVRSWRCRLCLLLGASGFAYGCADSAEAADREASGDAPQLDAGRPSGSARDAGSDALPPETEEVLSFATPQAGASAVYVPNPATNHVAVVNAGSFAIQSVATGVQPTFAATVPGRDLALVLSVGSRELWLLRTELEQTEARSFPLGHDANAIAIAPDGQRALVYLNANLEGVAAQSFQDLTVLELGAGAERATRVSVGFRPRGVQFSSDAARAFVITEDGISVLEFAALSAGSRPARLVGLGDGLGDAQSLDVQITPDGAFALARREGDSNLRLISLSDGTIETLALAALALPPPRPSGAGAVDAGAGDAGSPSRGPELTDLDLAPDGSFALAVLRDRGALLRIPVPAGFRDPSAVLVRALEGPLIGSIAIARSGRLALAYTTATPVESALLIDLSDELAPRGLRLRKSVRAVALSEDGMRALVLHAALGSDQPPADEEQRIDASEGYSLVDTATGFVKLQLTAAPVHDGELLITPDRARAFALIRGPGAHAVEMADLDSFQVSSLPLTRPPTSIGFLPGLGRVFVGQSGAGGQISFLDARTGEPLRVVSGFELATRIRQ